MKPVNRQKLQLRTNEQDDDKNPVSSSTTSQKIAIVDGMVRPEDDKRKENNERSCPEFNDRLISLTAGFSEVILVFDTYRPDSLKVKARQR